MELGHEYLDITTLKYTVYIYIYIYEDDMQLGKLKEICFGTEALSQTQKNVSQPQMGIEPVWGSETFFWVSDKP